MTSILVRIHRLNGIQLLLRDCMTSHATGHEQPKIIQPLVTILESAHVVFLMEYRMMTAEMPSIE